MSDLADRLREDALVLDRFFYADDKGGKQSVALMREAADELDRLSDENAQVRALYDQHLVRHAAQLDRLSARAAELEAVLREVEWSDDDLNEEGNPAHFCVSCGSEQQDGHTSTCRLARLLSPLPEEG